MGHITVEAAEAILDQEFEVLDHGFVRLVDYLGGDARIVQAARVSYGEGTKTLREDAALIDYLLRNRHCYDAETEVLTDEGFLPWEEAFRSAQAGKQLKVGIWDESRGSLVYEPPLYWTKDFYSGKMYRVDHGGVDLLVTPEHKMFVSQGARNNDARRGMGPEPFGLVPASELDDRSAVRYKKVAPFCAGRDWKGEGFPWSACTKTLLEFIGFFVGDGHAAPVGGAQRNFVVFDLEEEREIAFLHSRVEKLGWRMAESGSYGGRRKFRVYAPDVNHICRDNFYDEAGSKTLPRWCLQLNADDSRRLLNGLRHSGGSDKRGIWRYAAKHWDLAEKVQRVCLHAGEAADCVRQGEDMWSVNVLSGMREPIINQDQSNTSWQPYEGSVYCAHTRTGVMVVRRGGKIVLSGNTSPFEQVILTFHVKMPIFVARQWIRHRTARLNEISGRYSIMRDEFYLPRPHEIRYQSRRNRQGGSAEEVPEELREKVIGLLQREQELAYGRYQELLEDGLARELARVNLPLSLYTEMYWQIDLNNLFHFLRLRMDWHAQYEIRAYGDAIAAIARAVAPLAYDAFEEHLLHGATFSRTELAALRQALDAGKLATLLQEAGLRKSRRDEFFRKLGLPEPAADDAAKDAADASDVRPPTTIP
ncbi:MAG TPA: FAD-dependent thymidylate synthase [Trueperaceae bacterium]